MRVVAALLLVPLAAACGPAAEPAHVVGETSDERVVEPEEPATKAAWIDFSGTSVLGFGILRLVPPESGEGRFRIHYRDQPDGYTITDNAQLFVLPGDAFAERPMAFADRFLAFRRTPPPNPDDPEVARLELDVELTVDEETTVLVAYGPWTGPDTGRPSGDDHTFDLRVAALGDGCEWEWIESEAGELITTNWTNRPSITRGGPVRDPDDGAELWVEVRPLILYDARFARSADELPDGTPPGVPTPAELRAEAATHRAAGRLAAAADAEERADDLAAVALRRDTRIVLTPELTERFRRVPIRWR